MVIVITIVVVVVTNTTTTSTTTTPQRNNDDGPFVSVRWTQNEGHRERSLAGMWVAVPVLPTEWRGARFHKLIG